MKNDQETEVTFLQKVIYRLRVENKILRKQVHKSNRKPRYTLKEHLQVIWYLEYFHISRRQVKTHLGIARSTLYRWLNDRENTVKQDRAAHILTPLDLAELVWEIAKVNPHWGRIRIAIQIALFNVFISASTVRNILNRPRPQGNQPKKKDGDKITETNVSRPNVAHYPNHVWSVDRTIVKRWGLWPTFVLVGIDHLEVLCRSYQEWYNEWRPHYRLGGKTPNQVFNQIQKNISDLKSKIVSFPIERRFFKDTNTTAFRLKEAA